MKTFTWDNKEWTIKQLAEKYDINERCLYQRIRKNDWIVNENMLSPKLLKRGPAGAKPILYEYNGQKVTMSWICDNFKRSHQWFRNKMVDGKSMQSVIDELLGKSHTTEYMRIAMNAFPLRDKLTCNNKLM